jgi:cell division protein FtsL
MYTSAACQTGEGIEIEMYSLKERSDAANVAPQPILAAKRRRQLHPFFFSMGPVTLCVTSVLLIGLMAVLYLSQVGQAVAANQKLQDVRVQQSLLDRENQDLANTISYERSPSYIAQAAKQEGLIPADPNATRVLVIQYLKPVMSRGQSVEP